MDDPKDRLLHLGVIGIVRLVIILRYASIPATQPKANLLTSRTL